MTSPLHLEQQRHGERPARDDDRDAVAALAADDARVLERLPPSTMAARIRADLERADLDRAGLDRARTPASRRLWQFAPVLAAAAVLAVVVVQPGPIDGGDRSKGLTPALELHVASPTGPRTLRSGDVVDDGARLQVKIRRADARHGVIVSIDGSGAVTRHFPDGADTSLPVGTTPLPFSFELDDAPGFERFFLVTSDAPIAVDAVVAAAQTVGKGPSPTTARLFLDDDGLRQSDVLLRKRVSGAPSTR